MFFIGPMAGLVDESVVDADLDGDADKVDQAIGVIIMFFKKNPAGLDLGSNAFNY